MKKVKSWQAFERFLFHVSLLLGTFAFAILFTRFFVVCPGQVDGPSMEPTFLDEDHFFINKMIFLFTTPKRFDVVQVIDPTNSKLIIKRVIALPGERVQIKRGKIFTAPENSSEFTELDESEYLDQYVYTQVKRQTGVVEFVVGEDEYFVVGDNRPRSTDSRSYGPIHRTKILGKVMGY